jgi:hypothetical protein
MKQGNFIDVFLARHVSGTHAHYQEHQMLSCINKITLLHQVGTSNYFMRKMHGQTTRKFAIKVTVAVSKTYQCYQPRKDFNAICPSKFNAIRERIFCRSLLWVSMKYLEYLSNILQASDASGKFEETGHVSQLMTGMKMVMTRLGRAIFM